MYERKLGYGISKNCCCSKNDDQTQVKEISNPIPFCSIFNTNSKTNLKNLKEKVNKNSKSGEFHIENKMSKSFDYIYNPPKKDILYQEITGIKNKNLMNPDQNLKKFHWKSTGNQKKKKINLIYITNRILVADDDHVDTYEYDKALHSLNIYYGKYLKTFHLSVRSTVENPQKDLTNYLSSLPLLMPLLYETYYFLTNIHNWLLKSRKNVILLKSKEKSYHLLEVIIRFLIVTDETNERLFKPESIALSNHEANALLFYEKMHLEKFLNSSLKRYVATVSSISFGILKYHSNPKHLHFVIIKTISSARKIVNQKTMNSPMTFEYSNKNEKFQSIFITIYQNFNLIYTSDKILLNHKKETDKIIFVIEPVLPFGGDILLMVNVTNRSDLQDTFFRVQFHTCWLNGSSLIFKNSELDVSRDYSFKLVEHVELLLKPHSGILKEYENLLLSHKYSISDKKIYLKDIFDQLKLLDYSTKKTQLSYNVGPLNGNIYASISNSKSKEREPMYDNDINLSNQKENSKDASSILQTFNILENEISNAVELLSSEEKVCPKAITGNQLTNPKTENIRVNLMEKLNKDSIDEIAINKESDQAQNSSNIITNDHIQFDKLNIRKYQEKQRNPKKISPYDNLNFQKNPSDDTNNSFNSEEEKALPLQNVMERSIIKNMQNENKYISNLNVCNELKDSAMSSSIYSKIHSIDQSIVHENDLLLYDNLPIKQSKTIINAINTQHLWYRPYFTRQTAILYLLSKPIGHFIIRPSTSLWKSLSIALKYSTSIFNPTNTDDDKHIKHFIIDINTEGYRIRGFVNEKYYKTLPLLVQDHTENNLGLPCKLILPQNICDDNDFNIQNNFECAEKYSTTSSLNDFQVIYLGSFILTNLFDSSAIITAIDKLQEKITHFSHSLNNFPHTKMTLKLTADRIIFTDLKRKVFLRKYCKFNEIICCTVDPKRRVWKNVKCSEMSSTISDHHSPIFGILSSISSQEVSNQVHCQLFATINCNSEELCAVIRQSLVKF